MTERPAWRGAVLLGGLALGAWATFVEPRGLLVRRAEIAPPGWPPALDGLRVALLADLHAGGPHKSPARIGEIARRVAEERPDLVLLLGDYVDHRVRFGRRVRPEAVAAELEVLDAPLGSWAVLGNHDWVNVGRRMAVALERHGTRVLADEAHEAGRGLWVAGIDDLRERDGNVATALTGVPSGAPVLLIAHDPDVFPRVPKRVALTLAGHTHGGQIAVPRLRARFIPSRYGERYASGLIEEGGRLLYVTTGVGESGVPMRLGRPPEAVILTLRSGPESHR